MLLYLKPLIKVDKAKYKQIPSNEKDELIQNRQNIELQEFGKDLYINDSRIKRAMNYNAKRLEKQ